MSGRLKFTEDQIESAIELIKAKNIDLWNEIVDAEIKTRDSQTA